MKREVVSSKDASEGEDSLSDFVVFYIREDDGDEFFRGKHGYDGGHG